MLWSEGTPGGISEYNLERIPERNSEATDISLIFFESFTVYKNYYQPCVSNKSVNQMETLG